MLDFSNRMFEVLRCFINSSPRLIINDVIIKVKLQILWICEELLMILSIDLSNVTEKSAEGRYKLGVVDRH